MGRHAIGLRSLVVLVLACAAAPPPPANATSSATPQQPAKATPTAANRRAPVKAFATLPAFQRPALSPGAERLAALVRVNAKQSLVMMHLFKADQRRVINLGDLDIGSWRWVNDEWLVASVFSEDNSFGFPLKVSRLVALSMSGKTIIRDRLFENIVWTAQDGQPVLKMVSPVSIYSEDKQILT